jgi:hypothetical protein
MPATNACKLEAYNLVVGFKKTEHDYGVYVSSIWFPRRGMSGIFDFIDSRFGDMIRPWL